MLAESSHRTLLVDTKDISHTLILELNYSICSVNRIWMLYYIFLSTQDPKPDLFFSDLEKYKNCSQDIYWYVKIYDSFAWNFCMVAHNFNNGIRYCC